MRHPSVLIIFVVGMLCFWLFLCCLWAVLCLVVVAAAAAYMAKLWQNLSRDKNSSLSVLSVKEKLGNVVLFT